VSRCFYRCTWGIRNVTIKTFPNNEEDRAKWERRWNSAATSTVIQVEDKKYVNKLNEPSTKVFYNANGTLSQATNNATLKYNL
jgi:hypothetical protein